MGKAMLSALVLMVCVFFQAGEARAQGSCIDTQTIVPAMQSLSGTTFVTYAGEEYTAFVEAVRYLKGEAPPPGASMVLVFSHPAQPFGRAIFFDAEGCLVFWADGSNQFLAEIQRLVRGEGA